MKTHEKHFKCSGATSTLSDVTDTLWCDVEADEPLAAARGLASRLADGHPLPVIDPEFMGATDEALHADLDLRCWHWTAGPTPTWEHHEFIDFRSPGILALTVAASAIGNHRRHQAELLAAAPRWRPFGTGQARVLLTSQRLIICTDDDAVSLWLDEPLRLLPDGDGRRVEIFSDTAAPMVFEGPWTPYVAIALTYQMTDQILPC